MADNEILQIVVFSIFFGVAVRRDGERAPGRAGRASRVCRTIMLRVTGYVMMLAPLAVFCAMAATVATQRARHPGRLRQVHGRVLLRPRRPVGAADRRRASSSWGPRVKRLIKLVQEPFLLAFSTASSEAAYPKMLEQLAKFPISRKISSFVLPLGYSFNLDGSMMYCTFATLFIAQAYDIHLALGTQIAMLLTLMLTSKGMAGVPRASLVVIAATLSQFKLPEEGLLLILGIDTFLDMGRSATNVIGNSLATAVVAKWEGQLVTDEDTELTIEDMEGQPA